MRGGRNRRWCKRLSNSCRIIRFIGIRRWRRGVKRCTCWRSLWRSIRRVISWRRNRRRRWRKEGGRRMKELPSWLNQLLKWRKDWEERRASIPKWLIVTNSWRTNTVDATSNCNTYVDKWKSCNVTTISFTNTSKNVNSWTG